MTLDGALGKVEAGWLISPLVKPLYHQLEDLLLTECQRLPLRSLCPQPPGHNALTSKNRSYRGRQRDFSLAGEHEAVDATVNSPL